MSIDYSTTSFLLYARSHRLLGGVCRLEGEARRLRSGRISREYVFWPCEVRLWSEHSQTVEEDPAPIAVWSGLK